MVPRFATLIPGIEFKGANPDVIAKPKYATDKKPTETMPGLP